MGNCFVLCRPNRYSCPGEAVAKQQKVLRVMQKDGKILDFSPSGISSMANTEQAGGGIKRIKVVITKKQLQELLSKEVSVEEVLSGLEKTACSSMFSSNWKPKLESIPEGSE